MTATQIIEMDVERDRKVCIHLDQRVTGANRELAQWLIDHPRYPATAIAEWLGCGATRIKDLRRWAKRGFTGSVFHDRRPDVDEVLESQENLHEDAAEGQEPKEEEEDTPAAPEVVMKNILDTVDRHKAVARAYKKIFKASSADQAMKDEVSEAVGTLIKTWQSLQRALAPKRR